MSETRDEVKRFHLLEQEGIERSDPDKTAKGDVEWFNKLRDAINEEMKPKFSELKEVDWDNYAYQLGYAAYHGRQDAATCQMSGVTREWCIVTQPTKDQMTAMDRQAKTTRGVPCSGVWQLKPEKYRYNAFINDVTACFHRAIEHYEVEVKKWHKEGKCMWRE